MTVAEPLTKVNATVYLVHEYNACGTSTAGTWRTGADFGCRRPVVRDPGDQRNRHGQVAEEAPVSKRTLCAHFRTKNDLVIAHLQGLVLTGATLESLLDREDLSPGSGSLCSLTSSQRTRVQFADVRSSMPLRSSRTRRARSTPTPANRHCEWCAANRYLEPMP